MVQIVIVSYYNEFVSHNFTKKYRRLTTGKDEIFTSKSRSSEYASFCANISKFLNCVLKSLNSNRTFLKLSEKFEKSPNTLEIVCNLEQSMNILNIV